jgi:hypothetical protein
MTDKTMLQLSDSDFESPEISAEILMNPKVKSDSLKTGMPALDIYYRFMRASIKQGVFFSLNGPFPGTIVRESVEMLKKLMKQENASNMAIWNVFSIAVEMLQNINRYSASKMPENSKDEDEYPGSGSIFAGLKDDRYFIMSSNPIENSKINDLRGRLEIVCGMEKNELRKYYKKQLRSDEDTQGGGAGLGLIEIARKSSRTMEFDFKRIDEHLSYFSLLTYVNRE